MIDKLPFTDDGYLKTNTNTNKWPNRDNAFLTNAALTKRTII